MIYIGADTSNFRLSKNEGLFRLEPEMWENTDIYKLIASNFEIVSARSGKEYGVQTEDIIVLCKSVLFMDTSDMKTLPYYMMDTKMRDNGAYVLTNLRMVV